MPDRPQPAELKVNASPETARGVFSNLVLIRHTPEEFVLDFLLNVPGDTHLQTRVIVTPGHAKRIVAALRENIDRYESGGGFQSANTEPA
jgi:hypothetical protein